MTSKISAALVISGDNLDFDTCTAAMGAEPTSTFVRDFDYDSTLVSARQWTYETPKDLSESVDDTLQILLQRFLSRLSAVRNYCTEHEYDVEISCSVDVYDDRPLYELSVNTVEVLSVLRARFSMEVHDYTDE